MSQKWWQRYPGWLRKEADSFRALGETFQVIDWRQVGGALVARVNYLPGLADQSIRLDITYPDLYPWFPPEVAAPTLRLERHQNPRGHNLCLLTQHEETWRPSSDTAAELIASQIPHLLSLDSELGHSFSTTDPEPYSVYYDYTLESGVIVESDWELDADAGRFEFEFLSLTSPDPRIRVAAVSNREGQVLAQASARKLDGTKSFIGSWVRLPKPPPADLPHEEIYTYLRSKVPELTGKQKLAQNFKLDCVAAIYPEQATYGTCSTTDAWLVSAKYERFEKVKHKKKPNKQENSANFRPFRAGSADLMLRIPELQHFKNKRVAIFGLGGLGAPIALELAKSQIKELALVDKDFIDPATSVRYPFGQNHAGTLKTRALVDKISRGYPQTLVRGHDLHIGAPHSKDDQQEFIDRILQSSDLIVDATANELVQLYLSSQARSSSVDYLAVNSTSGGWGGWCLRIASQSDFCWNCLQQHWASAEKSPESSQEFPRPSASKERIRPQGCHDSTFTAASYDLQEVISMAARLIATTLAGNNEIYDDYIWLCIRDRAGNLQLPNWESRRLYKHPECPSCS